MEFDHLVLAAADLDAAADELRRRGLGSVAGGRHEGHGTANRIVPLGADYLELVAVVDPVEARGSRFGSAIAKRARAGGGLAALCLRTGEVDATARRLGVEPVAMSRRMTDGTVLRWRLAGLPEALSDGLPFFIEWDVPHHLHPGRMAAVHRVQPRGIAWVEVGGDPERLRTWVGDHALDLRLTGGPPGPRAAAIATVGGELVLGG